jgi:hypothetical protein
VVLAGDGSRCVVAPVGDDRLAISSATGVHVVALPADLAVHDDELAPWLDTITSVIGPDLVVR